MFLNQKKGKMAIIRRHNFRTSFDDSTNNIDLIDTPEKFLTFVSSKEISIFPLDVNNVATLFNVDIQYIDMDDNLSGILTQNEETNKWIIQVNSNHHPNRQRYTIAHELGHFCLHRHLFKVFKDQIFFRGTESNPMEWQANEFASAILMPENEFREFVKKGVTDIETLASKFKVSTLALRIRAKNLGMTGHGL